MDGWQVIPRLSPPELDHRENVKTNVIQGGKLRISALRSGSRSSGSQTASKSGVKQVYAMCSQFGLVKNV